MQKKEMAASRKRAEHLARTQGALQEFNKLRLEQSLTDIVVCSNDVQFHCHQAILAACSPVFATRLCNVPENSDRLTLNEIDSSVLGQIIDFIYNGKVTVEDGDVNKLLEAAKQMSISQLELACLSGLNLPAHDVQDELENEITQLENIMDNTTSGHFCVYQPTYATVMMSNLNKMRRQKEFTDVTFLITISDDNVEDLFAATSLFQILAIQNTCISYMDSQLDASNCLGIQAISDAFSCQSLSIKAGTYSLENYNEVCQQEEFLTLTKDRVVELIEKDLCVQREEQVYESIIRWVNYDLNSRKEDFQELFKHIRLEYVSSSYLQKKIMASTLVLESLECSNRITQFLEGALSSMPERQYSEILVNVHGYNYKGCQGVELVPKIQCYDPRMDEWFELPSFVMEKGDKVASACNLKDDIFILTKHGKTWLFKSSKQEWVLCSCLFTTRRNHQTVGLDGKVYVLGGQDGANWCTNVNFYDPVTDTWTNKSDMLGTRCIAATTYEGKIYAVTGRYNSLECYNPITDSWSVIATMPEPESAQAVALNGQIYILMHGSNFICYSLKENASKYVGRIVPIQKSRRYACRLAVCNGKIYVTGGCDKKYQNVGTVDMYNFNSTKWDMVGTMPYATWGHCCLSIHRYPLRS
ncbi:kelch-like protein 24 [Saccoglossus kowalevskii]